MSWSARRAGIFIAAVVVMAAAIAPCAHAAKPPKLDWDQVANVKDAAKRLGAMQIREGSEASLKFLEACYKTHMLAEKYTAGLEACMAQDYMLSQVLAIIYSKVPKEQLDKMKAPAAEVIAASMRGRFQAIFQQYKISQEQADGLKQAVDKHAMPIFIKAVFPKSNIKKEGDAGGRAGEDAR